MPDMTFKGLSLFNDADLSRLPMKHRDDATKEREHGNRRQSRQATGNRAEQEQNAQAQMNVLRLYFILLHQPAVSE